MHSQQQFVSTAATYQVTPDEAQKLRSIHNLGIVEVVLGTLILLSGIAFAIVSVSFFQGIWGGIIIIMAGGFGIAAGNPNSTNCMNNTHLAFAIIGAIFAAILLIIHVYFSIIGFFFGIVVGIIYIILSLLALAAFIVLIISATYSCRVKGGCCAQNYGAISSSPQVVLIQQPVAPAPGQQQPPPVYPNQYQQPPEEKVPPPATPTPV